MKLTINELVKDITKLGFEPKTLSTGWYHRACNGTGKNILLNENCEYLYLCEVQKWIRDEHGINVVSYPSAHKSGAYIYLVIDNLELITESHNKYNTYKEALINGIKDTIGLLNLEF